MQRMRERAELIKSLESIRESTAVAEVNKKNEDLAEVLPDLPAAVERFKKGENVTVNCCEGFFLATTTTLIRQKAGRRRKSTRKS